MSGKTPKRGTPKPNSKQCCNCKSKSPIPKSKTEQANWQTVLEDVNYIREKLQEEIMQKHAKSTCSTTHPIQQLLLDNKKLFGKANSIESTHNLYAHIIQLHKQNSLLKDEIQSLTKRLQRSQQKCYQVQLCNKVMKEENKKLEGELIQLTKPIGMSSTSTYPHTYRNNYISQRNTGSMREPEGVYSINNQANKYSTTVDSREEPEVVRLNQQFDRLIAQSHQQRNKTSSKGKSSNKLRRQLVKITQKIKQVNNETQRSRF